MYSDLQGRMCGGTLEFSLEITNGAATLSLGVDKAYFEDINDDGVNSNPYTHTGLASN